jgi:hypothetical protein
MVSVRDDIRQVFALRPSPGRFPIAVQAGLAMGLPITAFTLAGQPEIGLLASTGAFTALYLANRSRRTRAALLPLIALGLVASSALGVVTSSSLVASLIALFAVAAISAPLCLGLGVGPPAALFFVLVTGVSSHLAAPVSLEGSNVAGGLVVGMLACGSLIAYLVVLAPLAVPYFRRQDAKLHRERAMGADAPLIRFDFDAPSRIITFRLVLASGIAVLVAAPLGVHRVYWVLLTVVAILQNGHRIRLTAVRGIQRIVGTVVGVGLFAVIALIDPKGLWLALLLALLQFSVELIVIRNYGLALILITPLALTIAAQGHSERLIDVVSDRVVDTLLGGAIALLVLLVSLVYHRLRPSTGISR